MFEKDHNILWREILDEMCLHLCNFLPFVKAALGSVAIIPGCILFRTAANYALLFGVDVISHHAPWVFVCYCLLLSVDKCHYAFLQGERAPLSLWRTWSCP